MGAVLVQSWYRGVIIRTKSFPSKLLEFQVWGSSRGSQRQLMQTDDLRNAPRERAMQAVKRLDQPDLRNRVCGVQVSSLDQIYNGCYIFDTMLNEKPCYRNPAGAAMYWHSKVGAWLISMELGMEFWAYRSKGSEEYPPLGQWNGTYAGRPVATVVFCLRREDIREEEKPVRRKKIKKLATSFMSAPGSISSGLVTIGETEVIEQNSPSDSPKTPKTPKDSEVSSKTSKRSSSTRLKESKDIRVGDMSLRSDFRGLVKHLSPDSRELKGMQAWTLAMLDFSSQKGGFVPETIHERTGEDISPRGNSRKRVNSSPLKASELDMASDSEKTSEPDNDAKAENVLPPRRPSIEGQVRLPGQVRTRRNSFSRKASEFHSSPGCLESSSESGSPKHSRSSPDVSLSGSPNQTKPAPGSFESLSESGSPKHSQLSTEASPSGSPSQAKSPTPLPDS